MNRFEKFPTWDDVLAHVAMHECVYYHAPMDVRPVLVKAAARGDAVRVVPFDRHADPFTADRGHFDRFERLVKG